MVPVLENVLILVRLKQDVLKKRGMGEKEMDRLSGLFVVVMLSEWIMIVGGLESIYELFFYYGMHMEIIFSRRFTDKGLISFPML